MTNPAQSPHAFAPLARLTPERRRAAETGTLVAGSDRLRREYAYAYDHQRMSDGDKAWPEPSITGFDALLRREFERARAASAACPILLSTVEQHELFRSAAPQHLAHLTPGFADGWALIHAWRIDFTGPAFEVTENTRTFAEWAQRVTEKLEQTNAITSAQLADLADELRQPLLDTRLHLTGFDVLTPQQQQWLDRTELSGGSVYVEHTNNSETRDGQTRIAAHYPSDVAELTAAVSWARARLEQSAAASASSALPRIAIIVPDLLVQPQRARATRLLHAHLEGSVERTETLYNVGGGPALSAHPLVESALRLLATIHEPTHYTELQQLLADPALPGITSPNRLPSQCGEFLTLAEIPQNAVTDALRIIVRQVASWRDPSLPARPVAEWWNEAASVLRNARWHTARNDSEGYQATNALLELLITQAPTNAGALAWADAYSLIESVASQQLFAPASYPAPIQVLGYLEANELEFDHLWITGMDAASWPTPVTNNPLLPASELARAEVPRSSYSSELEFAERWLRRVTARPAECRVSFVNEAPDHDKPLAGISPLLQTFSAPDLCETEKQRTKSPRQSDTFNPLQDLWAKTKCELEVRADYRGHKLPQDRLPRATRRLENQAACPMRGWSLHHLNLEEPIAPHSLPNPLERGVLLHNALQALFEEIPSSQHLLQLDKKSQAALCKKIAHQHTQQELHRFSETIRELEEDRLSQSLLKFLLLEESRGEFSVAELEQEVTGRIGSWEIHLKIDRIDDVPDGQIVIDYKSTAPAIGKLQDERLTAPQIPLYVLFLLTNGKPIEQYEASNPLIKAGAFAELKPDQARYIGLRDEQAESLLALRLDHKTPWTAVLKDWREKLLTLTQELANGHALANPTKDICSRCHLHSLCRYHLSYE